MVFQGWRDTRLWIRTMSGELPFKFARMSHILTFSHFVFTFPRGVLGQWTCDKTYVP